MTILSYNIRNALFNEADHSDVWNNWRFRRKAVVNLIEKANPDVIALQEDSTKQQQYIETHFRKSHQLFRERSFYQADNANNGILVRKTLKVIDSGAFWISRNGKHKGKVKGSICFRHATYTRLRLRTQQLLVVNVHLDHTKTEKVKIEEASTFIKLLRRLSGDPPINTIVVGDFNTTPTRLPHRLFQQYGLRDSGKRQNNAEPTNPHWLQHPKCERIDYIWASRDLITNLRQYKVLGDTYRRRDGIFLEPSDHYPVFAEFILP